MPEELLEKAGGIIVRSAKNGERELYVVHRPRYDDWSVPKGHVEAEETPLQAALRETAEETGFHCAITRPLPPYFYLDANGVQNVVHFFEMKFLGDGLTRDTEVDNGKWLPIEDAARQMSYPSLGQYLQEVMSRS